MVEALGGVGTLCLLYGVIGMFLWNSSFGSSAFARKWLGHGLPLQANRFLAKMFTWVGGGFIAAAVVVAVAR
jgi:hypothetical protein